MNIDNAVENVLARIKEVGMGASFTHEEIIEWLEMFPIASKLDNPKILMAFMEVFYKLVLEHKIRLEPEGKDKLSLQAIRANDEFVEGIGKVARLPWSVFYEKYLRRMGEEDEGGDLSGKV